MKKFVSLQLSIVFFSLVICLLSCSIEKKLSSAAKTDILEVSGLKEAHVGISIFEPSSNKYWYNYQGDKYFVPASNTKIFSCYAAMKYLGDSLPGIAYAENGESIIIAPTGDPTLLHPDYKQQPVVRFLQQAKKNIYIVDNHWKDESWGSGWSWDDYNGYYMAERSSMPVYGNVIKFVQTQTIEKQEELSNKPQTTVYTVPDINWKLNFSTDTGSKVFSVARKLRENVFTVIEGIEKYKETDIPFITDGIQSALELLKDTTGKEIKIASDQFKLQNLQFKIIHSQPVDSLLKPMMHRSDNFFAEQTLLMVSDRLTGVMSDNRVIDTLLKTDLKELPQKPGWTDGSGLSRFNLITPQDFVWILNKMKNEFSWQRITNIFSTGNEGTLRNYYISDSSFIHAKTGSLSGVIAISGYLTTKQNKTLIFSVLVNNHRSTATIVRRSVEKFLHAIREQY